MPRPKLEPTVVVRVPLGMKVIIDRMKVLYKKRERRKAELSKSVDTL